MNPRFSILKNFSWIMAHSSQQFSTLIFLMMRFQTLLQQVLQLMAHLKVLLNKVVVSPLKYWCMISSNTSILPSNKASQSTFLSLAV
jgi:hypothetical protein